MEVKDFIEALKDRFFEKISKKVNWGKERVKMEFIDAVSETIAEHSDTARYS